MRSLVTEKILEKIKHGEFVHFETLLPVTPQSVTLADTEPEGECGARSC